MRTETLAQVRPAQGIEVASGGEVNGIVGIKQVAPESIPQLACQKHLRRYTVASRTKAMRKSVRAFASISLLVLRFVSVIEVTASLPRGLGETLDGCDCFAGYEGVAKYFDEQLVWEVQETDSIGGMGMCVHRRFEFRVRGQLQCISEDAHAFRSETHHGRCELGIVVIVENVGGTGQLWMTEAEGDNRRRRPNCRSILMMTEEGSLDVKATAGTARDSVQRVLRDIMRDLS